MKKLLFVVFIFLLLVSSSSRADVISPSEHTVANCIKIVNLNDYPNYLFFHKGDKLGTGEYIQIVNDECFDFYKLNQEYVYAIDRTKYETGQYDDSDFIRSQQTLQYISQLPNYDIRSEITEEYIVSLNTGTKTLTLSYTTQTEKDPFVGNRLLNFWYALIITLVLELLISAIYMKIRNKNKKLILAVFVGNLISLPLVWFVVPFLPIEGILLIILSEIFVIILESIIIRFLVAKTTWKEAVLISILLNLISWILGGIILLFILFW